MFKDYNFDDPDNISKKAKVRGVSKNNFYIH